MSLSTAELRQQAQAIWQAAVAAVQPGRLLPALLADSTGPLHAAILAARRIIVVGAGKAGASMSAGLECGLGEHLQKVIGLVNVPAGCLPPLQRITLHIARPAGMNEPTAEGIEGTRRMLQLVEGAEPSDVVLCLLSGGGSALLPAPAADISLGDKQRMTRLLHVCGAAIGEMNAVRKHLSDIKGGRLAEHCRAGQLFSLILSDVIGDPLDVIASGPTSPDPTTFSDAQAVLDRYGLLDSVPASVRQHLEAGVAGRVPETPKDLADSIHNLIIGNNQRALAAAAEAARRLGYAVLNLGSWIEGDTAATAAALAGIVRSIRRDGVPFAPPVCLLSGGETTVTLPPDHGKGGRNQEFALALATALGSDLDSATVLLCAGTDGEDGPTDAAGALVDAAVLRQAAAQRLQATDFLARHDAYPFFAATGGLLRTGLTGTNVMDVRVFLLGRVATSTSHL